MGNLLDKFLKLEESKKIAKDKITSEIQKKYKNEKKERLSSMK